MLIVVFDDGYSTGSGSDRVAVVPHGTGRYRSRYRNEAVTPLQYDER